MPPRPIALRLAFTLGLLCAACADQSTVGARPSVSADPLALDFGPHEALTHVTLPLTLTNDGRAELTVDSLTITNDARGAFSVADAPASIAAGESAVLHVTYVAPADEGPDGALLVLDSDAANSARLQLSLSGRSVGCPAPGLICGGACVDAGRDSLNCGACGRACTGGATCQAGVCVCPTTCQTLGKNCGDVADGCGGTLHCGTCAAPETCGGLGVQNVCGCAPETDEKLCARLAKNCGTITATDTCGTLRTAVCGACTGTDVCGGSGTPNVCGCAPQTDAQLCAASSKDCGSAMLTDNCGTARTASCGTCSGTDVCGGSGTPNVCGCAPETDAQLCARLSKDCDQLTANDNCGKSRTVSCGSCSGSDTCGAGGTPNVCGCSPETEAQLCAALGKDCDVVYATDRCGGSRTLNCGSCTAPSTCGGGGTAHVCGCTGETDAQLCTAAGAECGTLSVTDRCGTKRTATCPTCPNAAICGATTPNKCTCIAESDTQFCVRVGSGSCGPVTANDNCGASRTVTCATDCWVRKADLHHPQTSQAMAAVGSKLYVVGDLGFLEAYDPATNTWTDKASLATARPLMAAASVNGKLYVLGGCAGGCTAATNEVDVYDPGTDTWSTVKSMPTARHFAAVGSLGSKIFVAGGQSGCCTPLSKLEVYDTATDLWTAKTSMPAAQDNTAGAVFNGLFYVAGGWAGPGNDSNGLVYAWDPATDLWAKKATLAEPRQQAGVAAGPGLYVTGGWLGHSNGQGDIPPRDHVLYDAANDRWVNKALTTVGHYYTQAAFLNGVLYVTGSVPPNTASARVDAYFP